MTLTRLFRILLIIIKPKKKKKPQAAINCIIVIYHYRGTHNPNLLGPLAIVWSVFVPGQCLHVLNKNKNRNGMMMIQVTKKKKMDDGPVL